MRAFVISNCRDGATRRATDSCQKSPAVFVRRATQDLLPRPVLLVSASSMNICEHLTITARILPEHTAIRDEGRSFSYRELDWLSRVAAGELVAAGVGRGDRVALMLPNVPAFAVWYFAALRIGAVVVSLSTRAAAAEAASLLEDCHAVVLVVAEDIRSRMAECLPPSVRRMVASTDVGDRWAGRDEQNASAGDWLDMAPDDPASILYTSGTTGFSKGATLTHRNVGSNVNAFNHLCGMQPGERLLLAVPLFHCFGQNALLNSGLNAGTTLVFQRQFDLNETRRLLKDERVTQLYGVPMMFQLLLDNCEPSELSHVTYCFSAAATLPRPVSDRWLEKFRLPIHEGYGLTETSPFASYNHRLKYVPGSIGSPIDGVEMKIVDAETGRPCAPGQPGEIVVRGPNVMLGYWNRAHDTQVVIRDGWFHTGDIGRCDDQGYYYILDRLKDMISVGGLKVFPAEVERVLREHAAVADVAVVGVPHDVFGERVVAFVVLQANDSNERSAQEALASIRRHAAARLANYKVPGLLVPLSRLPRNPSGKVLKRELRELDLTDIARPLSSSLPPHDDGDRATTSNSVSLPIPRSTRPPRLRRLLEENFPGDRPRAATQFLRELIGEIANSESLPEANDRLLEIGMDSLMMVELSHQLQAELGPQHDVPATLAFDYPRIVDLSGYLVRQLDATRQRDASGPDDGCPDDGKRPVMDPHAAVAGTHERLAAEIDAMSEDDALRALQQELEDD